MKADVVNLGQVFTPENIVSYMLSLIRNEGAVLEPSCGNGAFLSKLKSNNVTAIEKGSNICEYDHLNIDFFDFETSSKYSTIIGNPPYVAHKEIVEDTKKKLDFYLFDKRTNLYLFFIDKCIELLGDDGELIFITPRDFLKQTSAIKLNKKMFDLGGFTHFKDFGDEMVFKGHSPNCAVWRWQKNLKRSILDDGRAMDCVNGQVVFNYNKKNKRRLGDIFDVKVGAVSGADKIFNKDTAASTDFICSTSFVDGSLKKMLYNTYDESLLEFKEILIKRKIRKFNGSNWWQWGRKYTHRSGKRIYVNCKTRQKKPFFVSDVSAYDGSVLALLPKKNIDLNNMCSILNDIDWNDYGFQCGGRYLFSQKSLENLFI